MSNIDSEARDLMVSIIVPVFNVASYLEEGLRSMADQDFTQGYEIILIDDASTDTGLDICRRARR
jgi:glycosyltransferase involved in cell wall biosynthesis